MSTRAASAAAALRAKQELIRLLSRKLAPSSAAASFVDFDGSKNKGNGNKRKAALDGRSQHDHHSMYSYNDLRSAYLERIHLLHPDKTRYQTLQDKEEVQQQQQGQCQSTVGSSAAVREGDDSNISKRNHHDDFVALQEAWKRYEVLVKKSLLDINNNKGQQDGSNNNNGFTEGSFTMFGVGCSFSDNETERALREEITNQACRGWFSAGQLEESSPKTTMMTTTTTTGDASVKLSDDDMFVEVSNRNEPEIKSCKTKRLIDCNSSNGSNSNSNGSLRPRKSLVDHMLPRNYGK